MVAHPCIWKLFNNLNDSHPVLQQPFFKIICLFLHLFHFNVRCSFFHFGGRHHRLPQGNSSIIGWDLLMAENLKILFLQRTGQPGQQNRVLENAAAERHALQTLLFSDPDAQIGKQTN